MSMNLVFALKSGVGYVSFPYQTATEVTLRVLNAPKRERVQLIAQDVAERFDTETGRAIMAHVKALMQEETLELSMT